MIRRLTDEGWSPCCLLRSARAERALFNFGVTSVVRGDCREPAPWEATLQGVPTLLHLAPVSLAPPVVEAAERHGVRRFIAISSTRGLSRLPNGLADQVRRGEETIEKSSMNFTILRSAMIYGSRQDANVDRIARWLDRRSWMPLIDGGRARVQPVHVDDVVEAVLRSLDYPEETRRTKLLVAGPAPLTWREMVETLARTKGKRVRWLPAPKGAALLMARSAAALSSRFSSLPGVIERLDEDRAYDIDETVKRLGGWRPMDFQTGVERTYGEDV